MATIGLSSRRYVETKDDEMEVTRDETDVDVAAVGFALVDAVGYLVAVVVGYLALDEKCTNSAVEVAMAAEYKSMADKLPWVAFDVGDFVEFHLHHPSTHR